MARLTDNGRDDERATVRCPPWASGLYRSGLQNAIAAGRAQAENNVPWRKTCMGARMHTLPGRNAVLVSSYPPYDTLCKTSVPSF